jgi:hypothetical protein
MNLIWAIRKSFVSTTWKIHSISKRKTTRFILFSEIIAAYFWNYTKYIKALCGQNLEFVMLKMAVHIVCSMLYSSGSQTFYL